MVKLITLPGNGATVRMRMCVLVALSCEKLKPLLPCVVVYLETARLVFWDTLQVAHSLPQALWSILPILALQL